MVQGERAEAVMDFEKKRTYYSMRGRTLMRETREHLDIVKVAPLALPSIRPTIFAV